MVNQNLVSIKKQTIFALIPSVDVWAFYRIQKLRKFILIVLSLGFAFTPASLLVSGNLAMSEISGPLDLYSNPVFLSYIVGTIGISHAVLVYFIRKWSMQWNKKFQKSMN